MEIQIKKAVKAGNSSAVILPRAWLNKEVRIELVKKTTKEILLDSISIVEKYIKLEEIMGLYLAGSYARKEENKDSDIDILILTESVDREIISEGVYNILIISKKLLKQKLELDLFPIGQMIREAVPLINSDYLNLIKEEVKVTNKNVKWYIQTTIEKSKIIEKVIEKLKKNNQAHVDDRIAYTLVLRIITLHIIEKIIENKRYSKADIVELIRKISGSAKAYEGYLAVKNNSDSKNKTSIEEIEKLHDYLKKKLGDVERRVGVKN